jgi:formylglycine-generating enzyme required for sulfatase activity
VGYAQEFKTYKQTIPGSTIGFNMIAVPAGKFLMGGEGADEVPKRNVEVSAFWIGEKEVTFAEWDLFFKNKDIPQARNIDGVTRPTPQYIDLTWSMGRESNHPVNSISQQAAMMYCNWLYTKTGFFYRLPTEAEWEYACKAGNNRQVAVNELNTVAVYADNSSSKFSVTASRKPNAWGIYDMLGNLSEWTVDQYFPEYYTTMAGKDPITQPGGRHPRTVRGGSYLDVASEVRCANRIPSEAAWNKRDPQIPKSRWWLTDGMFVGFRVVRPFKQPSRDEIEKFYDLYLKN